MSKVRALVLRAPGTNCDAEATFAFQQAGAVATPVHVNQLISGEQQLSGYQIMVIPGGFTYGDDISAGRILANELRLKLGEDIQRFVDDGRLILGICNGFQVLVKAGLIPKLTVENPQLLTLARNDSGKFECRWVYLRVNETSPCLFTRGISRMYLPVAHGEGKVVAEPTVIEKLNVVLYYTDEAGNTQAGYPYNPNGSVNNIAGICDASGRIFGLMPHPERYIYRTQHPGWTRQPSKNYGGGLRVFLNAVEWAKTI